MSYSPIFVDCQVKDGKMGQAPAYIYNGIQPYANAYGVPDTLWENIAHYETGGFPSTIWSPVQKKYVSCVTWIGDGPQYGGYSYGLFQMHVADGSIYGTTNAQGNIALRQLTGHNLPWSDTERALLLDVGVQGKYAMPQLATAWNKYKATFTNTHQWWALFLSASGHPGGWPGNQITENYVNAFIPLYNRNLYGQLSPGQGSATGAIPGGNVKPILPANYIIKNPDFSWITQSTDISLTYRDHWARDVQESHSVPLTALVPGTVVDLDEHKGGSIGSQIYIIPDAYPDGVGVKADWKPSDGGFGTLNVRDWSQAGVVNPAKYGKLAWYSYHFLPGTAIVKNGDKVLAGQKLAMTSYYGNSPAPFTHAHTGWFYNWATQTANGTYPFGPDLLPYLQKIKGGSVSFTGSGGSSGGSTTGSGGGSTGGGVAGAVASLFAIGSVSGPNQTYTPLLAQVHTTLTANPSMASVARAIDEVEQFPGWIDLSKDYAVAGAVKIPDPIGVIRSTLATAIDNTPPLIVRSAIVALGAILLVMLVTRAVNDSGVIGPSGSYSGQIPLEDIPV